MDVEEFVEPGTGGSASKKNERPAARYFGEIKVRALLNIPQKHKHSIGTDPESGDLPVA